MFTTVTLSPSGKNDSAAVVSALERLKSGDTLRFEKGEYHFYKDGTLTRFFAISNNSACDKNIVFPIFDTENLTIDGGGSVFVFHDIVFPMAAHNCKNITLKNFTLDCAVSPIVAFTVRDKSDDGFCLEFDKEKNPFYIKDGGIVFKRESGEKNGLLRLFGLHSTERIMIRYLRTGNSSASISGLPVPYMLVDAEENEKGVYLRYREDTGEKCAYREGEELAVILDGGRTVDSIFLDLSENIKIKDITIRSGIGMGIIGQLCKNIEIDGFNTDTDYHGGATTTADALHFVNCDGSLEIHNCNIAKTMDDVLNVHGVYTVFRGFENGKITAEFRHREQFYFNPYRHGDRLVIIDNGNFEEKAEFIVESSKVLEGGNILEIFGEFKHGEDDVKEGFFIENPDRMPNLHLHDNDFYMFPHIRVSGAGDILIENNRIEKAMAAMLALDLAEYWYESGRIKNLIFRNNELINCNGMGGTSFIRIGVSGKKSGEAPDIHEHIEISGNTFSEVKSKAIVADGVRDLVLRDNTYISENREIVRIDGKMIEV